MSPRRPRYSSPGKVFIFGEYAVLAGEPALVAAVAPRFELSANEGDVAPPFHPESPAGKLLRSRGVTLSLDFHDPYDGSGGFGASTAQFILSYLAIQGREPRREDWLEAWTTYRQLLSTEAVVPSGADLVAQWCGGVTLFDPKAKKVENCSDALDWSHLLVFSAARQEGRKVRTHDHLQVIQAMALPVEALRVPLQKGIAALRARDIRGLGSSLNEYAEVLRTHGLEADATRDDRRALQSLEGMLGVKGAGALQADAIICLLDPARADRAKIIHTAEVRGLVLVADGLKDFTGVSCLES